MREKFFWGSWRSSGPQLPDLGLCGIITRIDIISRIVVDNMKNYTFLKNPKKRSSEFWRSSDIFMGVYNMYYFSGDLENDCFVMFNYLEELPLFGARNRMALNTIPKKPLSNVYGLTHFPRIVSWQNGSITYREKNPNGSGYFTKLRSMFPHFQEMFEEFIDLHRGGFKFTHVVINKNFKIKKHTDGNNIGVSCIIGIGDYEGGDLLICKGGRGIGNLDNYDMCPRDQGLGVVFLVIYYIELHQ